MATTPPLPSRTAANDRLIAATPYAQLTQRQKDYARVNGVKLQAPKPAAPVAPPTTTAPESSIPGMTSGSPAPDKGGWMHPSTGLGINPGFTEAKPEDFDHDAWAMIRNVLAQYGLPDSLAEWAKQELIAGKGNAEILLDLRQRPEFKAEFPEIDARQKAHLAPLNPGDIIAYRQQARQIMSAAGLPAGFYDSKDDFAKFISNDVSINELNDRVNLAKQATYQADPLVLKRLQEEYGIGPGSGPLTALFLDDQKAIPLLTRDFTAAQIGGAADRTGYRNLANATAQELATQGVTEAQARQGFNDLQSKQELFGALPGTAEDTIDQQTQLGAEFAGNANAQRRIENRQRARVAEFQGGGDFAQTQGGIVGLGRSTN